MIQLDMLIREEGNAKKKQHKHKHKHKRRHHKSKSDTPSSSSEEESDKKKRKSKDFDNEAPAEQFDVALRRREAGLEWMTLAPTQPLNASVNAAAATPPENQDLIQKTNPKELNPYFKDGGEGYPDEASSSPLLRSGIGDGGASWRLKALKRAQEQAGREGKKLDEVVEDRPLVLLDAEQHMLMLICIYAIGSELTIRRRFQKQEESDNLLRLLSAILLRLPRFCAGYSESHPSKLLLEVEGIRTDTSTSPSSLRLRQGISTE